MSAFAVRSVLTRDSAPSVQLFSLSFSLSLSPSISSRYSLCTVHCTSRSGLSTALHPSSKHNTIICPPPTSSFHSSFFINLPRFSKLLIRSFTLLKPLAFLPLYEWMSSISLQLSYFVYLYVSLSIPPAFHCTLSFSSTLARQTHSHTAVAERSECDFACVSLN